jgi:hypothetical protein
MSSRHGPLLAYPWVPAQMQLHDLQTLSALLTADGGKCQGPSPLPDQVARRRIAPPPARSAYVNLSCSLLKMIKMRKIT